MIGTPKPPTTQLPDPTPLPDPNNQDAVAARRDQRLRQRQRASLSDTLLTRGRGGMKTREELAGQQKTLLGV